MLESLGLLVCGALMQCTCPCSPAPLFKVLVIKIRTVRLDSRHMSLLTTSLIQGPGDQDTHTKGVQSCMHPIGLICIVMCCWLCCLGARSCLFNVGLMLVCINLCSHHLEGRCECMCLCSLYIPLCLQSRRSLVLWLSFKVKVRVTCIRMAPCHVYITSIYYAYMLYAQTTKFFALATRPVQLLPFPRSPSFPDDGGCLQECRVQKLVAWL